MKDRLLRCALRLVAEEGVGSLSLRAIAKRAGVSHGAPLRHFPNRAALLSAVAAHGYRMNLEQRTWKSGVDSRLLAAAIWAALHGFVQLWLLGALTRRPGGPRAAPLHPIEVRFGAPLHFPWYRLRPPRARRPEPAGRPPTTSCRPLPPFPARKEPTPTTCSVFDLGVLREWSGMATVTAEAIRSLAHTPGDDAALALMDGEVEVIHTGDATDLSQILYTRAALLRDYGEQISDADAEALAADLTTSLEGDG